MVRLLYSRTARQSDSLIVRQSHRQHMCDVRAIFKFYLFSFKFTDKTLKYTLCKVNQTTLAQIYIFLLSILCKSEGLSSCRTIEPSDYLYYPINDYINQHVQYLLIQSLRVLTVRPVTFTPVTGFLAVKHILLALSLSTQVKTYLNVQQRDQNKKN